ncbi:MAG: YifB family Mg chelatase-like AAA ATPase [Bacteroidales bacterium]
MEAIICRVYSALCNGLEVVTVCVEISITPGVGIYLIGLPDSAVRESLLRVKSALDFYNYRIPGKKIIINLAPADVKKEGSVYDLSIAIAVLISTGQILANNLNKIMIMGELSLDGTLRPMKAVLPIALYAEAQGYKACIFPAESAQEAADVKDIKIYGANSLSEVIDIIRGEDYIINLLAERNDVNEGDKSICLYNFKDVIGQAYVKRGLEIAASGNHNLLMIGPPGSGKSFMAKCLPGILPELSREEALETSKIYSVAGLTYGKKGLIKQRPFRTPHHTASMVSLTGGGLNATPGEISLAHNGVLYLDEMSQYSRSTLDVLRQPLEDGYISISRSRYKLRYPASFMLVGSMNPCPCGYAGDDSGKCTCTSAMIKRYMSKISGPLMDRIDITIRVKRVDSSKLLEASKFNKISKLEESSSDIAKRVARVRNIQLERFKKDKIFTNSQMNAEQLSYYCSLDNKERKYLNTIMEKFFLSARSYSRILKISRTIADMESSERISFGHISEAVQFRSQELL